MTHELPTDGWHLRERVPSLVVRQDQHDARGRRLRSDRRDRRRRARSASNPRLDGHLGATGQEQEGAAREREPATAKDEHLRSASPASCDAHHSLRCERSDWVDVSMSSPWTRSLSSLLRISFNSLVKKPPPPCYRGGGRMRREAAISSHVARSIHDRPPSSDASECPASSTPVERRSTAPATGMTQPGHPRTRLGGGAGGGLMRGERAISPRCVRPRKSGTPKSPTLSQRCPANGFHPSGKPSSSQGLNAD